MEITHPVKHPLSPDTVGERSYLDKITREVVVEIQRSIDLHGGFHSAHEGHSVLREEVEELWREVCQKHPDRQRMRSESIQVAAMAVKFIYYLCEDENFRQVPEV